MKGKKTKPITVMKQQKNKRVLNTKLPVFSGSFVFKPCLFSAFCVLSLVKFFSSHLNPKKEIRHTVPKLYE